MIYAGNRVFNANNIIATLFVIAGAVLFILKPSDNLPLFIIAVIVAIITTAGQAFYFEITTDELIIKNYMIPFLNIRYELNEITQVQFLQPNYRSTAKARVKVIRGDKQSLGVNAASLSIKDWQLFVNELSEKKIPVYIESSSLKSTIGIPED